MAFDLLALVTCEEIPDPALPVALLQAGLPCLHIRSLTFGRQQFSEYLSRIPEVFHSRIMIHTHYELALSFRLRGIHFTEKAKAERKEILTPNSFKHCQLSASFHSLADLAANDFPYDYVLLSPVFDSISKEKYPGAFSPEALKAFFQSLRKTGASKIYALGGVGAAQLRLCQSIGFDGAALYGAIWQSPDPLEAWKNLLAGIQH